MKRFLSLIIAATCWQASADIVKPLPKDNAFAKTTRAIAIQLRDGNISTGTTTLWAGQLKPGISIRGKVEAEALARDGFADAWKSNRDIDVPKEAKLAISVHKFIDGDGRAGDVAKMTQALMESNDYNEANKDLLEGQARYLWAVLRRMPVSSKTLVAHVRTKVMSDVTLEMTSVQYFLLINPDKTVLQFFTIQGSM